MLDIIELNNHSFSLKEFHSSLIEWGQEHKRAFPWRLTDNAFHMMIAELMLRRTQARQVVKIYNAFIEQYPNANALASAFPTDVASALFSLGLAWRVPAFQQIARALVDRYNGGVPSSYEALTDLPGIGDYVASAVCCFAFGQATIIVDTNTVRVAGRLFGMPTHAESRRRKPIRNILHLLMDHENPQSYNYAMLDLAALVCKPEKPDCAACPLSSYCVTGKKQLMKSVDKQ